MGDFRGDRASASGSSLLLQDPSVASGSSSMRRYSPDYHVRPPSSASRASADRFAPQLLGASSAPDEVYEAKGMRANILVARKRPAEAAVAWSELLRDFPERAKKENVALNLVVAYEEMNDFGRAIETLEQMKSEYDNPDFINARIERLNQRRSNLPGAQGLKR